MTNILTNAQAANFLRTTTSDAVMLQLLPLVDEYLKNSTGHDWTTDGTIHPGAISAAGMLLTCWYDNPGLLGRAPTTVLGTLLQLEAEAAKYRKYEFAGLTGTGGILIPVRQGDEVIRLVGTYGVTGDQTADFESVVSEDGQILQTSADDLSGNLYAVVLKHPAEDVSA